MAVACKIPGHICNCCHGSRKVIMCPNIPPMDPELAAKRKQAILELVKEVRQKQRKAAAEAYICPNTKPEYGSKCSHLAGDNDDHTPCPGCPMFNSIP